MAHMHLVLFPGLCCPPATASLLCPMGASLKSLKVLINHARSFSSGGFRLVGLNIFRNVSFMYDWLAVISVMVEMVAILIAMDGGLQI